MKRLNLRTILFVAMTTISAVPVLLLALWVEHTAVEAEIAAVHDRHLLVANNLAGAMSRYVDDVEAVFRYVVDSSGQDLDAASTASLLRSLTFRHVCILGADGSLRKLLTATPGDAPTPLSPDLLAALRAEAARADGKVTFTNVMRVDDRPVIFVLQNMSDGRIAIGALATDYLIQLQKSIAFGNHGHSAIIDRVGTVIAHPLTDWIASSKNIAQLPIVQSMMSGKTGVEQFYSPAVRAEMIAGYTVVPRTGWGVMVPQPMVDLLANAKNVQWMAAGIAILGIGLAAVISWWLARILSRPVEAVARPAREIADGQLDGRVPAPVTLASREMGDLAQAFNAMLDEMGRKQLALAAAEAADRAKAQFLANASHELRTPLTAIIGFSDVMRDQVWGPLGSDRYKGYARDIHDSATHLLAMIDDILDLSKGQSGFLEVTLAELNVGDCVGFTLRMLKTRADRGGVSLVSEVAGAPKRFVSDERKLIQILINLVSNAVKFTPRGGTVMVSVARHEDAVRIDVKDTGIGIAAEDLVKVMMPFGQVANTLAQPNEGFGLGLPLTKIMAESLGGRLELQSRPSRGTTATVILPERHIAESQSGRGQPLQHYAAAS